MNVKWVVENFTDSEDYRDLIAAIKELGCYCFVIGRHNHFDFNPSGFNEEECVVVQGSIQMTKNIHQRLPQGCFPIAYNTWDNYLCSTYYPHFSTKLFNDFNTFATIKNLKENKFYFY